MRSHQIEDNSPVDLAGRAARRDSEANGIDLPHFV
jgi:hypothetical protein